MAVSRQGTLAAQNVAQQKHLASVKASQAPTAKPASPTVSATHSPKQKATPATTGGAQAQLGSPKLQTPSSPSGLVSASGGNGSVVLVLGSFLLGVAEWNTIVSPLIGAAWHGKPINITPSDWQRALGAVVFLFIISFIASTSPEAEAFMVLIVIAMFIVFLVFNGSVLNGIFDFLAGGSQEEQQQKKTSTPAQQL